jgi:hypothetical protein
MPKDSSSSDYTSLARFLAGDHSMLKCTVCGAGHGQCDCWTKCTLPGCSWSYRKGTQCRNPAHSPALEEPAPMPVKVRKLSSGKYRVSHGATTSAKATTKAKAKKQATLLRAVAHGFKPTGRKR